MKNRDIICKVDTDDIGYKVGVLSLSIDKATTSVGRHLYYGRISEALDLELEIKNMTKEKQALMAEAMILN